MAGMLERVMSANSVLMDPTGGRGGQKSVMTNAFIGGQNGPMTNVGRYVQNSTYVRRNVIFKVVTFPRFIDYMPGDQNVWRVGIKTLFEVQAKIDGLDKGLEANFIEQEIGRTGKRQYDIDKVTEKQSDITLSLTDKYGQPYKQLLSVWLRFGMDDPETGVALITVVNDNVPDMLPDMYSAEILAIEPDPLQRYPQNAWLLTNVAPKNNGPDIGSRDLTSGHSATEMSIPFTSLQQTGYGVMDFAERELAKLNRKGLNPLNRKAFVDDIDEIVRQTAGGYFNQADDIAQEQRQ